jgi:putative solute:sodium symporter small subunit
MNQEDEQSTRNRRLQESLDRYWRSNLRVMAALLFLWAFASFGCGIVWADWLNRFSIGGFQLGFWFAQQGSIVTFVVCILVYCLAMNRLDDKHHQERELIERGEL